MRLYFIGLDGLSANIVLAEEYHNRWPNFKQFFDSGIYGKSECEEAHVAAQPTRPPQQRATFLSVCAT